MAAYLQILPVVVLLLNVSVVAVSGLKCYDCYHLETTPKDAALKGFLVKGSDPDCVNPKDWSSVPQSTCVTETSCIKAQVTSFQGTTSDGKQVTGTFHYRGCWAALQGNKCDSKDVAFRAFSQTLLGMISMTSMTGTFCSCAGDACNAQVQITPAKIWCLAALIVSMILGNRS